MTLIRNTKIIKNLRNMSAVLFPTKHTTLLQHPSDAHDVQITLNRRQNNVLCLQGLLNFLNVIFTFELVTCL